MTQSTFRIPLAIMLCLFLKALGFSQTNSLSETPPKSRRQQVPFRFETPTRLSKPFNVPKSWNSTPCVSPNGLEFYFTSQRQGWGTYLATRSAITMAFTNAIKLEDCGHHAALSSDALELYVNRTGDHGNADIFVLTRATVNESWSEPRCLNQNVNSALYERWVCISPDGLELFFTRSKEFSEGEFTIWVARRPDRNAKFGKAKMLPKNINCGQANAPNVTPDGRHLLFVSDREGGFGGSDIWVARRETINLPWSDPVNLGPVINTHESEWKPIITPDGAKLLFSRNPNEINWKDLKSEIWEAKVVLK